MNINAALLKVGINILAPLAIGFILRQRFEIDSRKINRVMDANLVVLVTLLGGVAFWKLQLNWGLLWLPVIAVLTMIIPGAAAAWRAKSQYDSPLDQGSFVLSCMISNRNTAGSLAVFMLLGEEGYAYSRVFVILNWLFTLTVCYPVAQAFAAKRDACSGSVEKRSWWKTLINYRQTPILGLLAGLILNASGVLRPDIITTILPRLVTVNMWLFLVPLGYMMEPAELKKVKHDYLGLFGIKFLLTPVLAYVLSKWVGLDGIALYTSVILVMSPTAIQSVIVSKVCRLNPHLTMSAFVITMGIFLVVIVPALVLSRPLWLP